MSGIGLADSSGSDPDLVVREPRQQRTREQWDRVLDAGVLLLEEGGYEAFTIAALCERAGVPPRALYARAATKDALFLAVYEHGMKRVLASENAFDEAERELDDVQRIKQAVRSLVRVFAENDAFLRSVVLISGAHPEVQRRGEAYRSAISGRFVAALAPIDGHAARSDRSTDEREFCFSLVFSAMVVRTAYGPGFGPNGDVDALSEELVRMALRYLRPGTSPVHQLE